MVMNDKNKLTNNINSRINTGEFDSDSRYIRCLITIYRNAVEKIHIQIRNTRPHYADNTETFLCLRHRNSLSMQ